MPSYRIYWLDENDRISKADVLIADNDRMVREGVRKHVGDAAAIEVWEGSRRIVHISTGVDDLAA